MSSEDYSTWPTALAQIARVVGREAALRLAGRFGGLDHVRIPRKATSTHLWASVLTADEWAKVVAAFGGEYIDLPRGAFVALAKAEIIALAQDGKFNHRQIALRVHVTERYVRRVLATEGTPVAADPRQMKLFGT